jgi:hypothetical protein
VVISARQNADALARAWFYLPRMLGQPSQVLVEDVPPSGEPLALRAVSPSEIANRAAAASLARAA